MRKSDSFSKFSKFRNMRIRYVSDLHIDLNGGAKKCPLFSDKIREDVTKDEVLVIAGDVVNDIHHPRFEAFLKMCKERWKKVIFVSGNHDFFTGKSMKRTEDDMRKLCKNLDVTFLNKDVEIVDGVPFIGCTLWSRPSMEAYLAIWKSFGDSQINIDREDGTTSKMNYTDYISIHEDHEEWLTKTLEKYKNYDKRVVITHHAPTRKDACHPKYKDSITNGFFLNDMDSLLSPLGIGKKGLYIFGHTHWNTYQERNDWVITSNCIGYTFKNEDVGISKTNGLIEF